jgi:hypothetical protein
MPRRCKFDARCLQPLLRESPQYFPGVESSLLPVFGIVIVTIRHGRINRKLRAIGAITTRTLRT